jgi:metal-responsive CopG/Arc/MetJ family transcriptional regulator
VRTKISITLTRELLRAIDRRAKQQGTTRSNVVAVALQAFSARLARDEQNARDLEIIDRNAHFLNQEAADVLGYQTL